jgi:hypothetical protein
LRSFLAEDDADLVLEPPSGHRLRNRQSIGPGRGTGRQPDHHLGRAVAEDGHRYPFQGDGRLVDAEAGARDADLAGRLLDLDAVDDDSLRRGDAGGQHEQRQQQTSPHGRTPPS